MFALNVHAHRQLVLSKLCLREKKKKKKIDTISLHNPTGYKERVGMGVGEFEETAEVNR